MKKILLSALAVFAFSFANAQEQEIVSSKGENYLPQQGDWSIGFSANSALSFVGNAFNGSTGNSVAFDKMMLQNFLDLLTLFLSQVKTLLKIKKQIVTLLTCFFSYEKQKDVDATTQFGLLAGYGKEWRKGSTRLQGFYGADALIGFGIPQKDAFNFLVGAQAFVGAEYFIFPKVGLGAQYSYPVTIGYQSTKTTDPRTNVTTETSKFGFNIGNTNAGFGTASVLLNLYFQNIIFKIS